MKREEFLSKMGRLPEGCELDVRVEEATREDGFTRERISFASSPGVRVPAFLLLPDDRSDRNEPAPAVLCIHQHAGEHALGKSEPVGLAGNPNVFFAAELCRRGYVCIAPDLECFEERRASEEEEARWKSLGSPGLAGREQELFVAMRYLQRGSSLQARYVWDLARAVDVLESRAEVDRERIGTIGHSLGGQEVCWAMLFDRRLKAGACSCGLSPFESIFEAGINHNAAAYVPGLLEAGDMDALISTLAPAPFWMSAGTRDWIFPIEGVRRVAQAAERAYQSTGAGEAFRYVEFEGGHGCEPDVREDAYGWLDRWLKE